MANGCRWVVGLKDLMVAILEMTTHRYSIKNQNESVVSIPEHVTFLHLYLDPETDTSERDRAGVIH